MTCPDGRILISCSLPVHIFCPVSLPHSQPAAPPLLEVSAVKREFLLSTVAKCSLAGSCDGWVFISLLLLCLYNKKATVVIIKQNWTSNSKLHLPFYIKQKSVTLNDECFLLLKAALELDNYIANHIEYICEAQDLIKKEVGFWKTTPASISVDSQVCPQI